jgi:zinc transport system substrate-binding protein
MLSVTARVAGVLLVGWALTACGALADSGETDDGLVATAFYPLHFVSSRVAGDHLEVRNLTTPGGEPHDLELSVRQTATLSRAGLVVKQHGFQPAVDDAVDQNAHGEVLDVADVVGLREAGDHHEDHEHAGEETHGDEGDLDPHFWLDPLLMADLADAVADAMAELDPGHAADYAANAGALRADLERLDREYADGLASCERRTVVVNHDAFGYLSRYGLHFEPIAGLTPGAEPTPGDLARLRDLIRDEGVTTVFSETLVSPKTAETLAHDLDIRAAVLDPVEGLEEGRGDDYLSLMRQNLAELREANGC